jgi:formate hydrogenlyase subunit 6/NADH:ubiquinone oxidoreductase subunit I
MRIPLPKIREAIEAIKALIVGPYTSKFPGKPHIPHKNFRGQPKFNEQKCIGCLACEQVCPVDAIGHEDHTDKDIPVRTIIHYTDTCIFCGECEAHCIADHEGISLSNDWDLAFFDRSKAFETIDRELQLCEICGEVIGCKAHLNWISEKLGELSYSNPTLYQSHLKTLGVIDDNLLAHCRDNGRSDRVKILCAQCRRKTTLTTS